MNVDVSTILTSFSDCVIQTYCNKNNIAVVASAVAYFHWRPIFLLKIYTNCERIDNNDKDRQHKKT